MPLPHQTVLRELHRLSGEPISDSTLLERFLQARDERAFRAIVQRYGPMVLRVCHRLVGRGDVAEDACQATFLVLARKAGSIHHREGLAAWLLKVARRAANKTRAAEARRRIPLDLPPRSGPRDPLEDVSARETLSILEQEIARLPDGQRLPVVLCILEGLSLEEAAARLGWTRDSVKGRLERGRRWLQRRLIRRGLSLSAALAVVEMAHAHVALHPVLGAASVARWFAGRVPTSSAGLAEGLAGGITTGRAALRAVGFLVLVLSAGATLLGLAPPQAPEIRSEASISDTINHQNHDKHGDLLPEGVQARLGTVRLRGVRGLLAFSPDGTQMAASGGSAGEQIHIWESKSGHLLKRLELQGATLKGFSYSPDGKHLVTWGNARGSRLWDLNRPQTAKEILGEYAFFTSDGRTLISVDGSGPEARAYLWDPLTGETRGNWKIASGVQNASLAPDGPLVVVLNDQPDRLQFYQPLTGQNLGSLPFLGDGQKWFTPGPKGTRVALAGRGGVRLVDVATSQEVATWNQRADGPAVFSTDGSLLAWTGYDEHQGIARLWVVDCREAKPRAVGTPVNRFDPPCFSRDGKALAVVTDGSAVSLRDLVTGKNLLDLETHESPVGALAFSPDGQALISLARDGVFAWEVARERRQRAVPQGVAPGEEIVALLPDGGLLTAERTADPRQGLFRRRDPQTWREMWRFEGRPDVGAVTVAPGGRFVALSGRGTAWLCILDLRTGKLHDSFDPKGGCFGCRLSADGETFVWHPGPLKGSDFVVRRRGQAQMQTLQGTPKGEEVERWVRQFPYVSPDGHWLLLPHQDQLCLWDLRKGSPAAYPLSGIPRTVWQVVWSPDSRWVALGGSSSAANVKDPEARRGMGVWAIPEGRRLDHLSLDGIPSVVQFSSDGRMLVTSDITGGVTLREVATGGVRRRLAGHLPGHGPEAVAWSADNRRLATGGTDTQILVWDLTHPSQSKRLDAARLKVCWESLANADAKEAFMAAWELARDPGTAEGFLRQKLPPKPRPDPENMRHWIRELDSEDFAIRSGAERALRSQGEAAVEWLQDAKTRAPSPEARRRLENLLKEATQSIPTGDKLQRLRALEVLDWIAQTPSKR